MTVERRKILLDSIVALISNFILVYWASSWVLNEGAEYGIKVYLVLLGLTSFAVTGLIQMKLYRHAKLLAANCITVFVTTAASTYLNIKLIYVMGFIYILSVLIQFLAYLLIMLKCKNSGEIS